MLMGIRAFIVSVFTLLGTITLGASTGAVWMVATLYLRHSTPALALLVGVLLAWILRTGTHAPRLVCAGLSALATIVAALSVNLLLVGVQIAESMGLALNVALRTAGSGLLWQLTRMATSPIDIAWYSVGVVLAVTIALRRRRR